MYILYWLIIGALAGWIAGLLVRGGGFGLIGDIIVGILGAIIGGGIAHVLGITAHGSMLLQLLFAVAGAVVLVFLARLIKRK